MNINPQNDCVLVRRGSNEERSPGGIYIPDTAKKKPLRGEVLAVGPGARSITGRRQEIPLSVGDKVLFTPHGGVELGHDDLVMLRENDILAVTT